MTYVLAQRHGWDTERLTFEVVGNLDGARKALAAGTGDGFLWEQSTTQPFVTRGEFRRVGVLNTPWPCFVIAVRSPLVESEELARLLTVLQQATIRLTRDPRALERIARHYQLPISEVQSWWELTRWATDQRVERDVLNKVLDTLGSLNIISSHVDPEALCGGGCEVG